MTWRKDARASKVGLDGFRSTESECKSPEFGGVICVLHIVVKVASPLFLSCKLGINRSN